MRISKKQYELIELLEKCNYLHLDEIDRSKFPESLVKSLVEKKLVFISDRKIASTTKKIKW